MNRFTKFIILAAFFVGFAVSGGGQNVLQVKKVNIVHSGLNEITPARQAVNKSPNQFAGETWYSRMTPNQKAIFFPFEYAKEMKSRYGAIAYVQKSAMNTPQVAGVDYKFVGFNAALPGIEQFNLSPFVRDTLVVDSNLTQYSYYNDGKYVTFLPIKDSSTGAFHYMDCITYDADNWEKDDSVRIAIDGQRDVPYITVYDDQNGMYYSITMETSMDTGVSDVGDYYYLNILNPTTNKMTRIGKICSWMLKDDSHQESINGALVINGDIYAIDNYNRLVKIDKTTAALSVVGKMKIGYANAKLTDYNQVVGIQGMAMEKSSGDLIISHLDWLEGAALYRIHLNSITDGVISSEKITDTSNSFLYMYAQPDAKESNKLTQPSAFNVSVGDDMTATLSFTAPTKLINGKTLPTDKGSLMIKCSVDGKAIDLGSSYANGVKPGANVKSSFTLTQGLHTLSVTLSASGFDSSLGDIVSSDACAAVVYAGYDAPAAPASAKLSISNNNASISWSASTGGKNAQWGAKFDANDITYTVIRNYDNHTVASGLKTTSASDNNLGDILHTYSYSIIAKSRGMSSDTVITNNVINGKYVNLPYVNKFEDTECLDFFTVHNLNNDGTGRSWSWNYVYKYVNTLPASTSIANNYYLYTPKFNFDADHVYLAKFDFTAKGQDETKQIRFSLSLCKDTVENDGLSNIYTYEGPVAATATKHVYFRTPSPDKYRLAFRDYSPAQESDYGGSSRIDNLSIEQALSVSAPDSVKALELTRGDNGTLHVVLSFKAPTTTIDGNALTSIDAIKVFSGDSLIKTISNPAVGSNQLIDVEAKNKVNTYTVAAYNANGEGWPREVSAFVGPDAPQPVDSLDIVWGESNNDVEMTWQAPTKGAHGGYIDPSALTYNIYKFNNDTYGWDLLEKNIKTTNYTREETLSYSQDYLEYAITASNSVGEGNSVGRGIFIGSGYTLPFAEPFKGSSLSTGPWLTDSENDNFGWGFDNGLYDDAVVPVANDSLKLMLMTTGNTGGGSSLITPIYNLAGYTHPAVAIYLYHERSCSPGSYYRIDATTDGSHFSPITDKITVNDDAGWVKHVFSLKALKGKKVQLGLYGYLDKPSSRLFADSLSVYNLSGTDLAASGISYDKSVTKVGKSATVNVIVSNRGANAVSDYIVDLYANNTIVGETMPDESLASGAERTIAFTVPVTAGTDTISCYAKVVADNDEVASNDQSNVLALVPLTSTLSEPQNLVGLLMQENQANLTWNAPHSSNGLRVVNDFENDAAFTIDDFNGWHTYDKDHQNTISMIRLYDNYWPNCHLPQAWMLWNPDKALASTSYFMPKDGKQCLISWGSNGILDTGFKSLDGYVNDDWLISPEILGGTTLEFDAYATAASLYGNSTLQILTSSTDDKPASFSLLKSSTVGSTNESWQHFSYDIPSDAKYVAIRNTFTEYAILLDNLKYSVNVKPVFEGYNLYHNGVALNNKLFTATNYNSAKAVGKYAVSAVYDLGESGLSNIVDMDAQTGISNVNSSVKVYASDGVIYVSGAKSINVYTTAGIQMEHIAKVSKSIEEIKVVPGIYIVRTDKGINKVIVK